jgi:formyl-CoA transferase/succinyl-CoA--D-citramalate CoA-transferase
VRVLELGSFIAGPFAGQLLGDYGAEVIKIEPPQSGDPMRHWGVLHDGDSLWWPSISRNKKSVCIDLRDSRGRDLVRRLATHCDIVIENFRAGRLAEWGLPFEQLSAENPKLILVHVSGFGQSGPRAHSAGFGSVGEAMGGIRYTTGNPELPPSRTGISLGDALAAMFSVIGALAALNEARESGRGQEIDVAIYEAVAALMESMMADFEIGGVRRQRTGAVLPGVAPSNVYPALDGSEVVIAGNADSVFSRLCDAMGRSDLATDDRFRTHTSRGQNMNVLDELIAGWTRTIESSMLLDVLTEHRVPAGRIFTAADMLQDEQYAARDMVVRHRSSQGWDVPMPGVVPKFSRTPGDVRSTGPVLGAHTRQTLRELGDLSDDELDGLETDNIIVDAAGS